MANAYLEARVAVMRILLIGLAVVIAGLFAWGAVAVPEPGWFAALPLDALAVALVLAGSRRRTASQGRSGGALMTWGGIAVGASVVVPFVVGNAT